MTSSFYDQSKDNHLETSVNNAISLVYVSQEEEKTQNLPLNTTAPVDFYLRLHPRPKKRKPKTSRK
jgi:hypothetical protein